MSIFTLSIHYITIPGEDLYIVGNVEELGKWKDPIFKMNWSEGH